MRKPSERLMLPSTKWPTIARETCGAGFLYACPRFQPMAPEVLPLDTLVLLYNIFWCRILSKSSWARSMEPNLRSL